MQLSVASLVCSLSCGTNSVGMNRYLDDSPYQSLESLSHDTSPSRTSCSTSLGEYPTSLSSSRVCWPGCGGGRCAWVSPGVRDRLGAGRGVVTAWLGTKLLLAMLCGWRGASSSESTGATHASSFSNICNENLCKLLLLARKQLCALCYCWVNSLKNCPLLSAHWSEGTDSPWFKTESSIKVFLINWNRSLRTAWNLMFNSEEHWQSHALLDCLFCLGRTANSYSY